MKNQELSKQIKELRNLKELSQEELSEKSGLSLRTVQRLENGESTPRGDTLKRLADALEISPDNFIDIQNSENTNLNYRILDKVRLIKLPWFIIGFALFGGALGFLGGIILHILEFIPPEPGLYQLTAITLSILFGALGIIVGNKIEKKYK